MVLAAVGDNFESAFAAVMYQARNELSVKTAQEEVDREFMTLKDEVRPEWLENWYDGLGYCELPRD